METLDSLNIWRSSQVEEEKPTRKPTKERKTKGVTGKPRGVWLLEA